MEDNHELIEIYISCRSLKDMDLLSPSDPQVILYSKPNPEANWKEEGKTEIVWNNLNPNFVKTFKLEYVFEKQQPLRFDVIDIDSQTSFEFLGSTETSVGAIIGAKNSTLILNLDDKKGKCTGKIILRAERVSSCFEYANLKIFINNLPNLRKLFFIHKTCPFIRIYRKIESQAPLLIYQSEVVKNSTNPHFKPTKLNLAKICSENKDTPFLLEVWDYRSSGSHFYIGEISLSVNQCLRQKPSKFNLVNARAKNEKTVGTLFLEDFVITEEPSFLDYIKAGTQLNLIVGIDFTESNGDIDDPNSLHTQYPPRKPNPYEKALKSVCEILINYDYDQLVPVFGFGGKPRFPNLNSSTSLHCFPLNGDVQDANVFGMNGIMDAYGSAITTAVLSGPTLFHPLISETMKVCQTIKSTGDEVYLILLILTDGEIHDMEETLADIVDCSHLPLSIIIVGIGNADFTNMEILDGDDGLVDRNGRTAKRDLVQFVPFNRFSNDARKLAEEVLEELPEQLTTYMKLVGKMPRDIKSSDTVSEVNRMNLPVIKGNHANFSPSGPSYGNPPPQFVNKSFNRGMTVGQQNNFQPNQYEYAVHENETMHNLDREQYRAVNKSFQKRNTLGLYDYHAN